MDRRRELGIGEFTFTVQIFPLEERIFRYTANKARAIALQMKETQGQNPEEEYTLGIESSLREGNSVPRQETEGEISFETYLPIDSLSKQEECELICLHFKKDKLKNDFFKCAFNEEGCLFCGEFVPERNVSFPISFEEVFENCCLLSANRAKFIAAQGEDFEKLTLSGHEKELVRHYFKEASAQIALATGGETENNLLKIKCGFPEASFIQVATLLREAVEKYILSKFYQTARLTDAGQEYEKEYALQIEFLNRLFMANQNTDILLKESSDKVYEALYCLCQGLPLNGVEETKEELIYKVEKKTLPLNGAALTNIYQAARTALLQGMLSRFHMPEKAEKAKFALTQTQEALQSIRKFAEKKVKHTGLFLQFLREACEEVKRKLLAYNKEKDTCTYYFDGARKEIHFGISMEGGSLNILDVLQAVIEEFLYSYVLWKWYETCRIAEETENHRKAQEKALKKLAQLLTVRIGNYSRTYKTIF